MSENPNSNPIKQYFMYLCITKKRTRSYAANSLFSVRIFNRLEDAEYEVKCGKAIDKEFNYPYRYKIIIIEVKPKTQKQCQQN